MKKILVIICLFVLYVQCLCAQNEVKQKIILIGDAGGIAVYALLTKTTNSKDENTQFPPGYDLISNATGEGLNGTIRKFL